MSTRRKFIAGLAAAPVAAVPALAAASSGIDPALAAIAEWRALEAAANADIARLASIEDAIEAELVALGSANRTLFDMADFNRMARVLPEVPELAALRSRLERDREDYHAARLRHGAAEAEAQATATGRASFRAMFTALETEPTTAEGAFALLELVAICEDQGERFQFIDESETAPARAIRAALRVLRAQSSTGF